MSMHISAAPGEIAERVLLPGDPLRAKYIAETYLDKPKQYNSIRNMFGYTGTYKGVPVSVQGTGMGIPSISIYLNELIREYGVKKLIRVGTCGAMQEDIKLKDVIIAQSSSTDSAIINNTFGGKLNYCPTADFNLLSMAVRQAKKLNIPVKVGNVFSCDRFYDDDVDNAKLTEYGILAVEMESAALYMLASRYRVQGLGIFTASDHLITGERATVEERQCGFNDMIRIALETAIA